MPATLDTETDWKKAAAAAAGVDMADIEKAFAEQSYNLISVNGKPLLTPQFRKGFEIVHNNDNLSRLVGIWVCQVDKERYYIPVFFINGNVKGGLLYRYNVKRMVPLTNDWCEYLVGLSQVSSGEGVPISDRRTIRNQMNLIDIVEPPIYRGSGMRKVASYGDTNDKVDGAFGEWVDSIDLPANPTESILYHFIQQDGGFSSIRKIASATRKSYEFAETLFLLCKDENYMPELEEIEKKASVVEPILTWHQGLLYNNNVKSASVEDMAKGWKIDDFRKEAHLNEVVYDANTKDLSSVVDPGKYNVLLADGSMREMLVGYYEHCGLTQRKYRNDDYGIPRLGPDYAGPGRDLILIDPSSGESSKACTRKEMSNDQMPMGKYEGPLTAEIGVAKPEKGKAYRMFNAKKNSFSEPFYVLDVKQSPAGLTEITCDGSGYASDSPTSADGGAPILLNPDYDDYDKADRVYGKNCVFISVASKEEDRGGSSSKYRHFLDDLPLGDRTSLNMLIFDEGYKKATVKKADTNDRFLCHTNEIGKFSSELARPAATLFLMVNCSLREKAASEILDRATQDRSHSFFYLPLTKQATNIRFNQWPEMLEQMNNEFNVPQQPYTHQILNTERDEQYLEPQRIGDRFSLETGDTVKGSAEDGHDNDDGLSTKSPMELAQMSQASGNSSLFEHGVVGALTDTYDSMAMVDKWLPDMEKALDCVGRTLFLFYWKPEDFSEAYGSDDQSQLENKLVSNFKAFGDLVLEMLKKSKQGNEGTPSLS